VLPCPNKDEACRPEICTNNKEIEGPSKNLQWNNSLAKEYLGTFTSVVDGTGESDSNGTHNGNQRGDK